MAGISAFQPGRMPDRVGPLRVLIVDDSAVARAIMARAIEASGRFTVVAAVSSATGALEFLHQNKVEAIVLDIEMPGISGLAALPGLIAAGQGARVLVVSTTTGDGAAATIAALSLGAADTLVKPEIGDFAGRFSVAIVEKLMRLLAVDPVTPTAPRLAVAPRAPAAPGGSASRAAVPTGDAYDIVAIGASTGGIHALSILLREIPTAFTLPILITQHLPVSFMPYFAAQVAVLANRPCDVATDCMRIRSGRVIIAPGYAHMRVVSTGVGAAIRLVTDPVKSGCMPSVDPMFGSLAEVYGARVLGIVLSGMGRDGSEGARGVIARGGVIVAQDQASSVVWGMPGAIAGAASAVLPPSEIGRLAASGRRPA